MDGLKTASIASAQPVVKLIQSRDVWLRRCAVPRGAKTYLQVEGDRTQNVLLSGCWLVGIGTPTEISPDVPKGTVTHSA